jgi:arylsulfatase A-like enzyme
VTPGTRIERVTRSIDVMPTVLDLVGLADAKPAVSGRSLAPALAGKALADEPRSPNRSRR